MDREGSVENFYEEKRRRGEEKVILKYSYK
jgi:hypothetical protein